MRAPSVAALVSLGNALRVEGYSFVTVTPESHRRVLLRSARRRRVLQDTFGWSLPFFDDELPRAIRTIMRDPELSVVGPRGRVSTVRFSTLDDGLYAHSAYPTEAADAVFFGPDTYRFCRLIRERARPSRLVVDVGCGSGAGGIVASRHAERVLLADVNERALRFARANVELNGCSGVSVLSSDVLAAVPEPPDLIVANPPYLRDACARTYRDGGGKYGEALALRIFDESVLRLAPGGSLLLYTGVAVVDGVDTLFEALKPRLAPGVNLVRYEELDPDVFGEELSLEAYSNVDRIALIVLEMTVDESAHPRLPSRNASPFQSANGIDPATST